jgi:hypothetical protein
MYATHGVTGYSSRVMQPVLDADTFVHNGWGPWHEQGHTRQMLAWIWQNDMTEITVNIYSLYTQIALGQPSRLHADNIYPKVQTYLAQSAKDYDSEADGFVKLAMFWQLHLAFGDNFYPKLHQMYRELAWEETPRRVSGEHGKQMFVYMASLCAERNLIPFFAQWGIVANDMVKDLVQPLPTLMRPIWQSTDNAPLIEHLIPQDFALPELASNTVPNLNGKIATIGALVGIDQLLTANDSAVVTWQHTGSSNQHWEMVDTGDDTFVIRNVGVGRYLTVSNNNLVLHANIGAATLWKLNHTSSSIIGHVYQIQVAGSNSALDIAGSIRPQNGSTIGLWPAHTGSNQLFVFNEVVRGRAMHDEKYITQCEQLEVSPTL